MGLGYDEGVTHDYIRHGTTTLFAAVDVACKDTHVCCSQRDIKPWIALLSFQP